MPTNRSHDSRRSAALGLCGLLAVFLLIQFAFSCAWAEDSQHYLYGGSIPFPNADAEILDAHREILSLGINNDWLLASQMDTGEFTKALDVIAKAVEAGQIPGAVVFVDRFQHRTMPIAIGYKMTDPQHHRMAYDTRFYLQDLTGPLLTVPMVFSALESGALQLDDTVGRWIPDLKASNKGSITIEMLLRNTSGLPATPPEHSAFKDEREFFNALAEIPLASDPGSKVIRSPLNFLLLAIILEKNAGAPFSDQAADLIDMWFGGGRARLGIDVNQRQYVAPGDYNEWLRHMQWGEPEEAFSAFRGIDAGGDGLTAAADEVLHRCKGLLTTAMLRINWKDAPTTDVLSKMAKPDPAVQDGETMGLGYQIGRFGPKSFGWDSPHGSSIWILPEQLGYIIYLSNRDHPERPAPGVPDPRDKALEHFAKSLGWPRRLVDTTAMMTEASPSPESRIQGAPAKPDD